nr:MAG TPA: hypothetical protein [Caudoviricetes sp.]
MKHFQMLDDTTYFDFFDVAETTKKILRLSKF